MSSRQKLNQLKEEIWICENDHCWLSKPGPEKDTWHLEQLHPPTTGTNMQWDPPSKWLVAGPDPSICPMCAMRMFKEEKSIVALPDIWIKPKTSA
ncbi:MAG: hypothetical protein AAGD96_01905 [Chloroflexota bacterium]